MTGYRRKIDVIYAEVEALKYTCGGISHIAGLFGCSRDTVSMGINELAEAEALPKYRNRKQVEAGIDLPKLPYYVP